MIAEIHGKINEQNTNLSERREDQLTGNFFGVLRYIPYNTVMKRIFTNCVYPKKLSALFNAPDKTLWEKHIHFWRREPEAEPDILIEFENFVICVEVKYLSGLSSEDETRFCEITKKEQVISRNQLARQWEMLKRLAKDKRKALLLLGSESCCHQIYVDTLKNQPIDENSFGYMTWQNVFAELRRITDLEPFEQIIVDDLIQLLAKKGFERFTAFDCELPQVSTDLFWTFDYSEETIKYEADFLFADIKIERERFYEFRG